VLTGVEAWVGALVGATVSVAVAVDVTVAVAVRVVVAVDVVVGVDVALGVDTTVDVEPPGVLVLLCITWGPLDELVPLACTVTVADAAALVTVEVDDFEVCVG
jgi:hypothetical protein